MTTEFIAIDRDGEEWRVRHPAGVEHFALKGEAIAHALDWADAAARRGDHVVMQIGTTAKLVGADGEWHGLH